MPNQNNSNSAFVENSAENSFNPANPEDKILKTSILIADKSVHSEAITEFNLNQLLNLLLQKFSRIIIENAAIKLKQIESININKLLLEIIMS